MNRPEASEYADYYASYISKVPGSDVLSVLESQRLQMLQVVAARGGQSKGSNGAGAGVYVRGPPDAPPHYPGRALLPGHSARLTQGANLRPDAGMINVEALI